LSARRLFEPSPQAKPAEVLSWLEYQPEGTFRPLRTAKEKFIAAA
jgi:hypothetical protein